MGHKTLTLLIFGIILQSCSPDCKEVTIKKPVWNTSYQEYIMQKDTIEEKVVTIDTLVPYTMTKHKIEKEYHKNYYNELYGITAKHYITIRNNSDIYSNYFAIRIKGKEYNEKSNKWRDIERTSGYVMINPNSNYTFLVEHSDWMHNDNLSYAEGNVQIYVLQKHNRVIETRTRCYKINKKCIRRIDQMTFKDTVVNNCECNIEALKAEYKAIQETFERLKNEKLIQE